MSTSDFRQRFLFPDSDIRGALVQVEDSLAPILGPHDYPLAVQSLVGEAVVAAGLLAGTLKFEGRLSLHAQGEGPVSLLLAECSHEGRLRTLVRYDDTAPFDSAAISSLIGDGTLVIAITPDRGRQYQALVTLSGETLATCLEGYFLQSEQLPTRLWLASGNGRAAGLMLQRLPDQVADQTTNADHWQHLDTLASTLQMEELLGLDAQTLLRRLFHQTPPQLPPAQPLRFGCTCSRESNRNALRSLGSEALQEMLDANGEAMLVCEFCGGQEHFDRVDLARLLRET